MRRVSGSSPLSSTIQKALKLQRFRGFRHFIQFVALAILLKFHKIVLKSPCCAIPLERHGRGIFSFYITVNGILRFFFLYQNSELVNHFFKHFFDCSFARIAIYARFGFL